MAIIKCKMCGGDIELAADKTFGTCEFCGSSMTLPRVDDDQRAAAFNRGNHFRRIGEFDKALAVYERIVRENDTDAEAHWCCALCRFGIEYVEDPVSYEYLPTCHRVSFDSFLEDVDYLAAVEYSEGITKRQYQKDGAKIAEVQREILAASQNEEPFDVFICYKESDENGNRTRDSLMAQDVYYQLTDQGYRVFFARITLEEMAGKQYEPYIFAALNSAKVMVVIGTQPEYMNGVWVKNEWSRFLAMMKKDRRKLLLPCYKDMDPYDMPEQLSVLQSYDMSKIGFLQDLIRGIKKVLDAEKKTEFVKETVVVQQSSGIPTAPLLQRAFLFLEDGEWENADGYCEKVLDLEPQNARAYLGKLMAELQVFQPEQLALQEMPFDCNGSYKKALRFADDELRAQLEGYHAAVKDRALAKENAQEASRVNFEEMQNWISAGKQHTVAVRIDGTAKVTTFTGALGMYSGQCRVRPWRNIVAVSAGTKHTVGLCSDGTVRTSCFQYDATYGVCTWQNIIAISTGDSHTVGLCRDGTVVASKYCGDPKMYGGQCDVSDWKDIVAVSAGTHHTVGLRHDGTVLATAYIGKMVPYSGQCELHTWRDIVAISAGGYHTVGLCRDGTVVAVGGNGQGQCHVSGWKDMIAISAGDSHTVGLCKDGTVVAVGHNRYGQCEVSDWKDIIAISAGYTNTIGLRRDGTVVATKVIGSPTMNTGQSDVETWKLFDDLQNLEQEREHGRKLLAEADRQADQWEKAGKCRYCGGNIKGLLLKKCAVCGKDKDY